jgi:hypothetical protein
MFFEELKRVSKWMNFDEERRIIRDGHRWRGFSVKEY